jgi:uncharacterized protein with FMN-binding domain
MKVVFKILVSAFILFLLVGVGGVFYLSRGLEAGSKLVIEDIKPSLLNDGTYNGTYKEGRWSNEVSVTIKDRKITKIDIVKDVTFSKPEVTKEIFDKVVKNQTTNVDVVSGSTVTSRAYLKAVEDALKRK